MDAQKFSANPIFKLYSDSSPAQKNNTPVAIPRETHLKRRAWRARGPAHPHEPQTGPQALKYPHSARNDAEPSWRPPHSALSLRHPHTEPPSMALAPPTAATPTAVAAPQDAPGSGTDRGRARGSYGGRQSLRTCPLIAKPHRSRPFAFPYPTAPHPPENPSPLPLPRLFRPLPPHPPTNRHTLETQQSGHNYHPNLPPRHCWCACAAS